MGTLGAKRLIKTSVAPPSSGAQGTCPTCHTLDTPLDSTHLFMTYTTHLSLIDTTNLSLIGDTHLSWPILHNLSLTDTTPPHTDRYYSPLLDRNHSTSHWPIPLTSHWPIPLTSHWPTPRHLSLKDTTHLFMTDTTSPLPDRYYSPLPGRYHQPLTCRYRSTSHWPIPLTSSWPTLQRYCFTRSMVHCDCPWQGFFVCLGQRDRTITNCILAHAWGYGSTSDDVLLTI